MAVLWASGSALPWLAEYTLRLLVIATAFGGSGSHAPWRRPCCFSSVAAVETGRDGGGRRPGDQGGTDPRPLPGVGLGRSPRWVAYPPGSPAQTAIAYDPGSGERTYALKRWQDSSGLAAGYGWALLFTRDRGIRLRTASELPAGSELPSQGWVTVETIDHRPGCVPVIDLVNRPAVGDTAGTSEMADVEPLVDAICKLASDMLVSAAFGARPRRFTLGVEVREDADGNPINPFTEGAARVWQLEGDRSTAQVGQLDPMSLSPYAEAIGVLVHQVAAVSALPPGIVGVWQDQPASAEAMLSATAAIPAMMQVNLPAGLTAADLTLVCLIATLAEISSDRPARSANANAITGTSPANDTNFSSSNLGVAPDQA